jgi:signal transduction histidine kinase
VKPRSLRLRLILTYTGLIVLGFGGLALLAGQQISNAARRDYELRLTNEVTLIARSLAESVRSRSDTPPDEAALDSALEGLSSKPDTNLELVMVPPDRDVSPEKDDHPGQGFNAEKGWLLPNDLKQYPEFVAASRNTVVVDERGGDDGQAMLFTAAPVSNGAMLVGYVQLSVPASKLQEAIRERWGGLALGVLGITAAALLASIWLSTSLIRPLEKLRDSALRLSEGDLSHRVDYDKRDEIGAVAHAFNQMAEQVQAMIEEQRAFASNTSHELRTPLTTMRLRTEALRHDKLLDAPTQEQYVVELDEELARLSGLIDDLVLLSRFDAGRAEIGQEQIDPVRFAHSFQQSMSTLARDRDITLTVESTVESPVAIGGSLNHLSILFRNVLENAIKYTPPGGKITWRISVDSQQVIFAVEDTGHGIDPEHLPRVFERFYRADRSRSRSIPGTGLGLALAKSIVDTYGGQIEIASPGTGLGTTVTIRWPVSTPSENGTV